MSRRRPKHTFDFKSEAVNLSHQSEQSIQKITLNIGVGKSTLARWVQQAEIDAGGGFPRALTTDERAELTRLRREIRQVRLERDFLKKVSAFFAKEIP